MRNEDFEGVMQGLSEVTAYYKGNLDPASFHVHVPQEVDVKAIRSRLNMTQAAFAARFGFSQASVKDWEQKRRKPEASARVLLTVIDKEPQAVMKALSAA
ncbi:MAG: helix-turn-helix domain-containing protein [Asticcacaulis sp.]